MIPCPFPFYFDSLSTRNARNICYMQHLTEMSNGNSIPPQFPRRVFFFFLQRVPVVIRKLLGSQPKAHRSQSTIYIHTRSLECIPDRERIRRTSSSIPRLPRTFWPATRCTDDCKWIPAVWPDPPGIEALLRLLFFPPHRTAKGDVVLYPPRVQKQK